LSRLSSGGAIDRRQVINFRFNGKAYQGFEGDTLASALLANGVRVVGRSFKYHRPRGIVSCGVEETNALVQLRSDLDQPNIRATILPLTEGLEAESINCWPSVNFDIGAINGWLAPLFPAGFYYKTFMARPWDFYSRFIRRVAGLGQMPKVADTNSYERIHHHVDVLVIGAGPAGLSATLSAAQGGANVLLIDDQSEAGGDLLFDTATIDHRPALEWVKETTDSLDQLANVTRLKNTIATGYYDHNLVIAVQTSPEESWIRERLWHIRAKQVVVATGAVERPLVFANNDRPGVMLCASAAGYITRFGVKPGKACVLFTNNSRTYHYLPVLQGAGIKVLEIVDCRDTVDNASLEIAKQLHIPVVSGSHVINVDGTKSVRSVTVCSIKGNTNRHTIDCDLVCHSGGWNPLVHLQSHSGAKPVFDSENVTFIPGKPIQKEQSVGACNGRFLLSECISDGLVTGQNVAAGLGYNVKGLSFDKDTNDTHYSIEAFWAKDEDIGKAFVDYQNDVTRADLALAMRENFQSIEHIKRYTTAGMATDQGKMGNPNVIGIVAQMSGTSMTATGTTTYRPPFQPVSFGVIGGMERGALIIPARITPITQWNIENGAAMNEAGANFRRPFYYPKTGESMQDAMNREALATRNGCAIYDATPLGKFELYGEGVEELLNRVYTNSFSNLPVGQGRFGLMLREDGRLMDDGVTFKLDTNHYLMSCGTGAAPVVLGHIERLLQTEWQDLKVYLVNVSAGWANICVCGPLAREVLTGAGLDGDLLDSMKFMQMRSTQIAGLDVRIARVSYTGELSFEFGVRRRDGLQLWNMFMEAGRQYDITPIGSETSGVLRIEKGFVSPGIEGDNITNPYDAGLGWVIDMKKPDFIGKRSLQRDLKIGGERQHVVGLLPDDHNAKIADGSALVPVQPGTSGNPEFQGHVTAACYSPTLKRTIALALLKNGKTRHGESIRISGLQGSFTATVTKPVFYDPRGERMRA
jgi:sarcosine oxidase subunit alpha